MPKVPTYDTAQVSPTALPFAPVSDAGAGQMAQTAGRDTIALGNAQQQIGSAVSSIAIDLQEQANQVQVSAANNAAHKAALDLTFDPNAGYKNLKGDAALSRPDGKALPDEYADRLQTQLASIGDSLGNEAQKRAFSIQSGQMLTSFRGDVETHMLGEFRNHAMSVQQGTIALGADTAKLNWNNPDKIAPALDSVKAAIFQAGAISGESGAETAAKIKTGISAVHTGVIQAALENSNPEYAMSYMERNKDTMTADDLLRVRGVINKDVNQRVADGVATTVVSAARVQTQPSDFGRMIAITMNTESSGNVNAVGKYIPGQGTAKGSMQVMDATAKNPGFGIKPIADDSPEERARVGRELLPALVKNYGGDPAKAWAAYNSGNGTVDKAIAAAKKNGTSWQAEMANFQSPENFKETQAYVAKNMAAFGAGGGVPAKPTLQDIHDGVRARITAQYGPTPPAGVLKLALASASQQFEDLSKSITADENARTVAAMRELESNGGRYSNLSFATRAAIPADKVDQVLSYGQKISKGDDITNPAVYQALSNPQTLRKMSDNEFFQLRRELSASDFQHFSTQRAAALGQTTNKIEEINTSALNTALADRMRSLGMDPTPKDGSDEAINLGVVKKLLIDTALTQQKTVGKQMTDAEMEKHVDGMFAKSATFRSSFLGISGGVTSQRLLTMKPSDIPDDTRNKLKTDFKAAGVTNPTEGDLLGAYLKLKMLPQRSSPTAGNTRQSKSGTIRTPENIQLEADTMKFLQGL